MMAYRMAGLAALPACLALAFTLAAQGNGKVYRADYFTLQLPDGFEVRKSAPVQDFEVYSVVSRGVAYAGVYVGNQPHFPRVERDGQTETTSVTARDFRMVSVWKKDQLLGREILAHRPGDWPTSVHAWTAALPPERLAVADKIVTSLEVK